MTPLNHPTVTEPITTEAGRTVDSSQDFADADNDWARVGADTDDFHIIELLVELRRIIEMDAAFLSSQSTLVIGPVLLVLYLAYRAILPKPLAGIPYNVAASKKILGDVPELMGYVMRTKRIFVFIKPMALPWVVVTDPLESQDILLRRTKEFDRSGFFGELIGGILPEQHIQFLSTDDRFKKNRNLINHLMAHTFITQCGMAEGRPFSAHHDITYAALDSIFTSSFGLSEDESITIQRLKATEKWDKDLPNNVNDPISFPDGDIPEVFGAVLTLAKLSHGHPVVAGSRPHVDKYIKDKIEESIHLIEKGDTSPRSALHSVLLREREVSAKENRQPDYRKRGIADEFFGFMVAGSDTSATASAWRVKLIADSPSAQDRIRSVLQEALPRAADEKRAPTYQELSKVHIPYLDAVVEEILRHANTIAFVGTDVFLMANGAGYLEPKIAVKDEVRSAGARTVSGKALTGLWDDKDIADFRPERWLKTNPETGVEIFDPMAGPTLAFGLGSRGCFGKRLGLQALKIQFALIIWHFYLLQTPAKLNGYEAIQKFAREPTQCYVRLAAVE
ncbi:putative Cytochrome P450 [Seiridium unicorne]|uniref:Cytochrome P450 n=1 Tax=Seiridium unicorne TaxID=138068 RepID=A0ABR2UPK8_9PEZI